MSNEPEESADSHELVTNTGEAKKEKETEADDTQLTNVPPHDPPRSWLDSHFSMRLERYRKVPWLHLSLPLLALLFGTVALSLDQMSVGTVDYASQYDTLKSVHYVCGWQEFTVTSKYTKGYEYTTTTEYKDTACKDNFDSTYKNWCSDMSSCGKAWLGPGIVGIILNFFAMIAIYFFGKKSLSNLALQLIALILWMAGGFNWIANERCTDIEESTSNTVSIDTELGSSTYLMFVVIAMNILGILLSVCSIFGNQQNLTHQRLAS